MKSASMTWGLSLLLAICLTPNFRSVASRIHSPQPPIVCAQDEPPVALPGSADAQNPEGGDDNGPDAGQDQNAAPDEGAPPDAAAPPDVAAPDQMGTGNNDGMTDPNAGVDQPQDNPEAGMPQTNMQPPEDQSDDDSSSAGQQKQPSDNGADQDSPAPPNDDNN